jgi:hypothetical protein
VALLRFRGKLTTKGFDMESFEGLRDLIRDGKHPLVGGAPQVLKVYEFMNTQLFALFWPKRDSGYVVLLGRPLLPYEVTGRPVLDPDSSGDIQGRLKVPPRRPF